MADLPMGRWCRSDQWRTSCHPDRAEMNSFLTRWLYGLDISDQSYKASTSVNNDSTEIVIVQNVEPTLGNMYGIGQVLLICLATIYLCSVMTFCHWVVTKKQLAGPNIQTKLFSKINKDRWYLKHSSSARVPVHGADLQALDVARFVGAVDVVCSGWGNWKWVRQWYVEVFHQTWKLWRNATA